MDAIKNAYAIMDLAVLMEKACGSITAAASSVASAEQNANDELVETYKSFMLNELENLQHMVLTLTGFIAEAAQIDELRQDDAGSVFQEGELTDDLGDKTETDCGDVTVTANRKEEDE